MRILVLGGYGLIGAAVVVRLLSAGHAVIGLGRSVGPAHRRYPDATWFERDIATLASPDDWRSLLADIDAVVNCSGALQDSARDDVRAVQSIAMQALFEACARAGVRRIVQISAAGASLQAPTPFMRTKAEADAALARYDLDWVILRPGLVLAPAAYGATALLRALASVPLVMPLTLGDRPIQTVHVDDVAEAVRLALEGSVPVRTSYDLVEDGAHTLAEVVTGLRSWLGYGRASLVPVPAPFARAAFRIGDALGFLGWRSPLRTTAFQQIEAGVTGDPAPWSQATGARLSGLAETLRRLPATVQERWFGRLWLLKPLIIATLSTFWIVSGLVALARLDQAAALLAVRGIESEIATVAVVLGSIVDLGLGVAVLLRRSMPWTALGMVATTAAYLLAGSMLAPGLWLDPLGAYVKTIPGAILAVVAYALAEER
jgi:uncharacterized protein YbjT (DUF2867 family)